MQLGQQVWSDAGHDRLQSHWGGGVLGKRCCPHMLFAVCTLRVDCLLLGRRRLAMLGTAAVQRWGMGIWSSSVQGLASTRL